MRNTVLLTLSTDIMPHMVLLLLDDNNTRREREKKHEDERIVFET